MTEQTTITDEIEDLKDQIDYLNDYLKRWGGTYARGLPPSPFTIRLRTIAGYLSAYLEIKESAGQPIGKVNNPDTAHLCASHDNVDFDSFQQMADAKAYEEFMKQPENNDEPCD